MPQSVYLAGPIRGLTVRQAVEWRRHFSKKLAQIDTRYNGVRAYRAVDPTSGWDVDKAPDEVINYRSSAPYPRGNTFAQEFARDFSDACNCDYLVANFRNAVKGSLFSCMEVAWSYQAGKNVILILGRDEGPLPAVASPEYEDEHDHPALRACASFICENVSEALEYLSRRAT